MSRSNQTPATEEMDYRATRQDILRKLEARYGGALLLTLADVAKIYHYADPVKARAAINIRSTKDGRRRMYYIGDIASDLAKKITNGGTS